MIKKLNITTLWLCLLVVLVPGCGRKSTTGKSGSVKIERDGGKKQKGKKKSLFLDDSAQEFVFEEEAGTNAFEAGAMQDKSRINLVETPANREWEERRAQQAKYGFKNIYFDFDKSNITSDQEPVLKHNLAVMKKLVKQNPDVTFIIEGHTCNYGKGEYNILLSEKRAEAIARWVDKHGISLDHVKVVGRGYEMCTVPVGTKEQKAPDRRGEFFIEVE